VLSRELLEYYQETFFVCTVLCFGSKFSSSFNKSLTGHDVVWLTGVRTELKGIKVKVIWNKFSKPPDGYGFIEFDDEDTASSFLDDFDGKPLPVPYTSASPSDLVFRLSWAVHGLQYMVNIVYHILCISYAIVPRGCL
jgi:hypothetical protein